MRIEKHIKESDTVEFVKQAEIATKKVLLSSKIPYKGHKLFEVNLSNGSIIIPEYESVDAELSGTIHNRVIQKPGCMYILALNKKNAIKKVKKHFIEMERRTLAGRN